MKVEIGHDTALIDAIAEAVVRKLKDAGSSRVVDKRLLSLKEAGDYLGGKSASAIRHMVTSGAIPSGVVRRLGERRIFLDRIELDRWLQQQ